jgi:protein-disulfide isomerase
MKSKWADRLNLTVNIGIVVAALVVFLHPRGPIIARVSEWRAASVIRKELAMTWPQLISSDSRVPQTSDANGRVLVVFSDYQCPACRNAEERLPTLMAKHNFAVVYRHLPLTGIHPMAERGARAAICAESQGRFSEMHSYLFADDDWADEGDWSVVASAVSIPDIASFMACLRDEATTKRLDQDLAYARQLGLTATPSFVGARGVQKGLPDERRLRDLLQS